MKYSHRVSDAIHILIYIDIYPNEDLSSSAIANSINANPSLIRGIMSKLREANLLTSQQGVSKPKLTKLLKHITLYDVYKAIEYDNMFLHIDADTNQDCLVGGNIQNALSKAYESVQIEAERYMKTITLNLIKNDLLNNTV